MRGLLACSLAAVLFILLCCSSAAMWMSVFVSPRSASECCCSSLSTFSLFMNTLFEDLTCFCDRDWICSGLSSLFTADLMPLFT